MSGGVQLGGMLMTRRSSVQGKVLLSKEISKDGDLKKPEATSVNLKKSLNSDSEDFEELLEMSDDELDQKLEEFKGPISTFDEETK